MFRFVIGLIMFILLLLVFWFVFASYKHNYGFDETISYMARTINSWWQTIVVFFARLFVNTTT